MREMRVEGRKKREGEGVDESEAKNACTYL